MAEHQQTSPFQWDGRGAFYDQLMRWHEKYHSDKILLSYPNTNGEYDVNLTGSDLERTTAYAASKYAEAFKGFPEGKVTGDLGFGNGTIQTEVVAMISVSTLSSFITYIALHRVGLSPMLISPRLADNGYAHLLRVTGCHTAVASGPSLDMIRRVKTTYDGVLNIVPMLSDEDILSSLTGPRVEWPETTVTPGHILHTGGTTGLPKPVAFSISAQVTGTALAWRGPKLTTLATVPNYHIMGLLTFCRGLWEASRTCLLNAHRPVTASIIWKALDATGAGIILTVPYVLKFFADMEGGVERLAKLEQVRVGGSAMPDDLGDLLVRSGVYMTSVYGQTEAGMLMAPVGTSIDDWAWLTPYPGSEKHLVFEKVGEDMYHLVALPGLPTLKISDRPDGSLGTKDLFRPHPDNLPGSDTRAGKAKWKFIARQGDIVVLVNGENADPTPIESTMMLDPHVQMAVAFGAGHERLGLLVIPTEKATGMSKEEVLKSIQPALERGNKLASDYAKISLDDIIVKPVGTPYPQTAKMTLQRPVLNKVFAEDIEAHYAAREVNTDAKVLSDSDVGDIVRKIVGRELQAVAEKASPQGTDGLAQEIRLELNDDDDFFSMGMDSLQSSLVRKRLLREISLPDGATLATNVVFEFPSVRLLSEHIINLRQKKTTTQRRDLEAVSKAMLEKYAALVTDSGRRDSAVDVDGSADQNGCRGHVVVLTGATGYIGVQLLKTLLNRSDVSRVYCLVRTRQERDHEAAAQRIRSIIATCQLKDDLAADSLRKLTCFSSNLSSAADLGLSAAEYSEIKATVTHVIHNAWSVNFNMSLESFEPNVASVAHLLNLTQRQQDKPHPRAFTFISSVAAVATALDGKNVAQERIYEWQEANPRNGYGQSKWVAEHICAAAAKSRTDPVRILRVGQVSGDTKHGIWNPAEAIPAMVQSALTIGALPKMEGPQRNTSRWLPSDITAAVITELTMLDPKKDTPSTQKPAVFHVASPHTLRWNEDVLPALEKAGLRFQTVPQGEWVRLLNQSDNDIEKNPPYKLIEHFRQAYGNPKSDDGSGSPEGAGFSGFDLTQSLQYAEALKCAPLVDSELVVKYARYWLGHWGGNQQRTTSI